jgi:exopolysaccharide biosynthesis WecB/TagA/CpsF family protein
MPISASVQAAGIRVHRRASVILSSALPVLDFAALLTAAYLGEWMFLTGSVDAAVSSAEGWSQYRVVVSAALLGSMLLYDRRFIAYARRGQMSTLLRGYLTGFALFIAGVFTIGYASDALGSLPLHEVAVWIGLSFVLTAMTRALLANNVHRLVRDGYLTEVVAIVGAGSLADKLARQVRTDGAVGMRILGVFDDDGTSARGERAVIRGSVDDLLELGKTSHIDWIFLNVPRMDEQELASLVRRLKALAVPVAVCPWNVGLGTPYQMIDYVGGGLPVTVLVDHAAKRWRRRVQAACNLLPRWVSTWLLLPASLTLALTQWLRGRDRPRDSAGKKAELVCELDDYELRQFVDVAAKFGHSRYGYVVTPNVDHLIRLHDDVRFRELYAAASYVLLDSQFLAQMLRLSKGVRMPVCTGSDLTAKLLTEVAQPHDRIVVIGGGDRQVAELKQRYGLDNLAQFVPPMGFIRDPVAVEECLQFIEAHSPFRFCLIAVGAPQQEVLAERLQARGVARGLALCVGASIGFITGTQRRAPPWMRRAGLEWSYRLARNPARMATRYLVRGPRVFSLLRKTRFVLRGTPAVVAPSTVVVAEAEAA